jgi:hypothetical protein
MSRRVADLLSGRDGRQQRRGNSDRQGPQRLGNDGGEHPLPRQAKAGRALVHRIPPAREQADETGGQGATAIS